MATVLLLRHGRTTSNADGTLAGRTAVALDDIGVAQAEAAGERLQGLPLKAVVTSPLARCRQTVGRWLCRRPRRCRDDGLAECGYGDWEGQPLSGWPASRCGGSSSSTRPG